MNCPPTDTMQSIYVLQLANGKYYIGKTADVIQRFTQHASGTGAAWTTMHRPLRLVETRPLTSPHDENNTTKDYMKKYGIQNVRGGSYAQITLPDEVRSVLEREFRGNDDQCVKCGLAGHFVGRCTVDVESLPMSRRARDRVFLEKIPPARAEEWDCSYCDRSFTTKYGCSVHERSCRPPSPPTKKLGACYRCGRQGHWATSCYARRHVDGSELDTDGSEYNSE